MKELKFELVWCNYYNPVALISFFFVINVMNVLNLLFVSVLCYIESNFISTKLFENFLQVIYVNLNYLVTLFP